MMVVDSSAIVAIMTGEPERDAFIQAIRSADHAVMSALTLQECGMVLRGRSGPALVEAMYDLIDALAIDILAFTEADARNAIAAAGRYGKGVDARARLNLGDCAAYALARALDARLLFKGDDFYFTDVSPVFPAPLKAP